MSEPQTLRLGPEHPSSWWRANGPAGSCEECGGDCDGPECGLHAAGCIYGGAGLPYWMIADGCPRWHGES